MEWKVFLLEVPWSKLPASARELVLNGSRGELVFDRERTGRKFGDARPFIGFRKIILDKSAAAAKEKTSLPRTSKPARAILVAGPGGRFKRAHFGSAVTALLDPGNDIYRAGSFRSGEK